jgi:hypothetical protein
MSIPKEAKARIKINRLLEGAGWRFLDCAEGRDREGQLNFEGAAELLWSTLIGPLQHR